MKSRNRSLPLVAFALFGALACSPKLAAQAAVDAFLGFGTNHASAASGGIDNSTGASCVVTAGNSLCTRLPELSDLFMRIGGDIMFKEHFGGGFSYDFQPTKHDYGPFQTRQQFIDVNGIYAPISKKRLVVQIIGGIGAARTSLSFIQQNCTSTTLCGTQSIPVGRSNHFAVHAGVALQYFVTDHIFIKPEVDYHYVRNFTELFGSNSVPGAMISIGYGSSRQ